MTTERQAGGTSTGPNVQADLAELAAGLRASTVAIRSAHGAGSGSGTVWNAGTIVTNAHVARTATVEIETADGRRLRGSVERRDERRDLAAIRVTADDLRAARVRDAGELRVGELVVAFGHPLGVPNVLSAGIVFAPYRADSGDFVRSDVKLAPGNSGGPLADVEGRVVGINSMVAGGLALAIPSNDVRRFMGDMPARTRLGVRVAPAVLRGGHRGYAVVAVEPASAAERSGIMIGDVIVTRAVDALGSATQLSVLRGGEERSVTVVRGRSEAAAAA